MKNKITVILSVIFGTLTLAFTGISIFEAKAESQARDKGIEKHIQLYIDQDSKFKAQILKDFAIVRSDIKKLLEKE